jgi:hypothetical protein
MPKLTHVPHRVSIKYTSKSKASPVTGVEAHRCVSCEVRTSSVYTSKAIPVADSGGPQVFPVRYEHYLHIKK